MNNIIARIKREVENLENYLSASKEEIIITLPSNVFEDLETEVCIESTGECTLFGCTVDVTSSRYVSVGILMFEEE